MRKFMLMILAGIALMLAAPEFATATPFSASGGLATAAEQMGGPEQVRHPHWHHRHYRHYRYRHHYRHRCWHRRHWSGRRCW